MSEESIYNLIPPARAEPAKPSSRRGSKSQSTRRRARNARTGNHASQAKKTGPPPPGASKPNPKNFLKRGAKKTELPEPKKFSYTDRRKARVPLKASENGGDAQQDQASSRSKTAAKKKKNFLRDNARQAAKVGKTRNQKARAVQRKRGGDPMAMSYTKKADFGKVPEYLGQVKAEIEQEQEYIRQVVDAERVADEEAQRGSVAVLADEDREVLLEQLRARWEEVNREYQKMTHMVVLDTLGKVRKKEEFEKELAVLEKSIDKLSRSIVFVSDQ